MASRGAVERSGRVVAGSAGGMVDAWDICIVLSDRML